MKEIEYEYDADGNIIGEREIEVPDHVPTVEERFDALLDRLEGIPSNATAAQTRDEVRAAAADARKHD